MSTVVNIAAYKFAPLEGLKELREELLAHCKRANLKGTILLSTEGINLFVAGSREAIEVLVTRLRLIPGLAELTVKYSESEHQPFTRMLVRIKKEIIAFGVEGIDPARRPSPKLSPQELKSWLDEGRPVTLLDTRNDYEVKLGTFRGAKDVGITHFRDFPQAILQLPEELKEQPIVMFCTGGIRCEKAGPLMQREGYQQVYQLDGGILKYFEECGGAHYDGECFVFDQRVGVDPSLEETETNLCYACQAPLTHEETLDERYVPCKSCPYCYVSTEQQRERACQAREAAIARLVSPLPGSMPYDNDRPLRVPQEYDGKPVIEFLAGILPHVPRDEWAQIAGEGRLRTSDHQPMVLESLVKAGDRVLHHQPATIEPDVNVDIRVVYEDEAIAVVHKPAPLPLHASGRFHRNTLEWILREIYDPQKPRPVHRLDANTSGLVLFARTRHFAKLLQQQFTQGKVEKFYLALVSGHPVEDRFVSTAPISAEAGVFGSRSVDEEAGLPAETRFEVLARTTTADGKPVALVRCQPITGRTNQIRVHLWQLGHPIMGEQSYLADQKHGTTQTHTVDDPPLCLLAHQLSFQHPVSRERMTFTSQLPAWTNLAEK
ncbi:pseudouridine synthase, RluA family [Pirellula staleyi DSM 6068]|uniref:tRNA uridine(34) hydroxylase n=1 Tax=Pirellula staleyi (strain ATCC 27377 / DSM 6068 / ICPB 4128) TaxID=530564 RepID=D2R760_PIRSD|nr:sulfurtransferase [Pirellula staleyi]ADB19263.1 pseudouridine synthase, RluA family [Pirellula staleyi DSM 6068]